MSGKEVKVEVGGKDKNELLYEAAAGKFHFCCLSEVTSYDIVTWLEIAGDFEFCKAISEGECKYEPYVTSASGSNVFNVNGMFI